MGSLRPLKTVWEVPQLVWLFVYMETAMQMRGSGLWVATLCVNGVPDSRGTLGRVETVHTAQTCERPCILDSEEV